MQRDMDEIKSIIFEEVESIKRKKSNVEEEVGRLKSGKRGKEELKKVT